MIILFVWVNWAFTCISCACKHATYISTKRKCKKIRRVRIILSVIREFVVRDRGSNMGNMVNNLRLKLEAQWKAWRSFEDVLTFTCLTPLSDIWIGCYLDCCILVHLIFWLYHASSWLVWRKVSKLENFLQRQKLFVLIDYNLIVIDYNKLSKVLKS